MAPRSVEANEIIKDERRNKIMLSALKIFTKNGFSAAKMSDIAISAGVSYGLVYHYFKSKDEIYKELINHAINSLSEVINGVKVSSCEPIDQLRMIAVRIFESIEGREAPVYYYLLVMNAITCEAPPVSATDIIKESLSRLNILSNIILEGQRRGQIREGDTLEIAVTSFSTVLGLAALKVSGTIQNMPDTEILMRIF